MEEAIKITETETQMEDGSISVHCSALGPQGELVTMAYVVGKLTLELAPELRALVIQQHQNHARAAIEAKVRELRAAPALEVVPDAIPEVVIPTISDRVTRRDLVPQDDVVHAVERTIKRREDETPEAFRARILAETGINAAPTSDYTSEFIYYIEPAPKLPE